MSSAEHGRLLEHVRHLAMHDPARQTFRDRRLSDARLADEQRVVLLTPTQHLDGATDLRVATDQRVDLAFARLLVEVDAIGFERVAFLLLSSPLLVSLSSSAPRTGRASDMPGRLAMPWLM